MRRGNSVSLTTVILTQGQPRVLCPRNLRRPSHLAPGTTPPRQRRLPAQHERPQLSLHVREPPLTALAQGHLPHPPDPLPRLRRCHAQRESQQGVGEQAGAVDPRGAVNHDPPTSLQEAEDLRAEVGDAARRARPVVVVLPEVNVKPRQAQVLGHVLQVLKILVWSHEVDNYHVPHPHQLLLRRTVPQAKLPAVRPRQAHKMRLWLHRLRGGHTGRVQP
mmetsp:Transcript_43801/g.115786  ORF Transcript_43801/g.115786 Transcript_43801/m.115786 type:complete len:219 (+) Transcript_43801:406-1062(+)